MPIILYKIPITILPELVIYSALCIIMVIGAHSSLIRRFVIKYESLGPLDYVYLLRRPNTGTVKRGEAGSVL